MKFYNGLHRYVVQYSTKGSLCLNFCFKKYNIIVPTVKRTLDLELYMYTYILIYIHIYRIFTYIYAWWANAQTQ